MSRLVIVSNRLPVTLEKHETGYNHEFSSGGLVTALRPIVQRRHGCWIGWTGTDYDPDVESVLHSAAECDGFRMVPVFLSENDRQDFYVGFCNEILWPLFHDLQSRCNFEPSYWHRYVDVNSRFSEVISSETKPDDLVWVHDYHLMLQGKLLSSRLGRERLFYFHHIPFPPTDVFEKLPWRLEILESLLSFHVVGFQSMRDRRNFMDCIRHFFPRTQVKRAGNNLLIRHDGNETVVGAFPIGIDFNEFAGIAQFEDVQLQAQQIRSNLSPSQIILGVDRLDYTKGIPERLKAFRILLDRNPGLHGRVSLIQIVVPSREDIPNYRNLKMQVERLVGEINGHFGVPGWVPVHYLHRHVSRGELVAYYRTADVALVTPLKDGMNLVAKEFCAARVDETGVLILSEFAGSASQLGTGALLVNPYDSEQVASVLYHSLEMDKADAQRRMRRMRRVVEEKSVYYWCDRFLNEDSFLVPRRVGAATGSDGLLKLPVPLKHSYMDKRQEIIGPHEDRKGAGKSRALGANY
jgi:alpha,alpha-trehalose-phosphate synthase [UDP-forming]